MSPLELVISGEEMEPVSVTNTRLAASKPFEHRKSSNDHVNEPVGCNGRVPNIPGESAASHHVRLDTASKAMDFRRRRNMASICSEISVCETLELMFHLVASSNLNHGCIASIGLESRLLMPE